MHIGPLNEASVSEGNEEKSKYPPPPDLYKELFHVRDM